MVEQIRIVTFNQTQKLTPYSPVVLLRGSCTIYALKNLPDPEFLKMVASIMNEVNLVGIYIYTANKAIIEKLNKMKCEKGGIGIFHSYRFIEGGICDRD